MFNRKCYIGEMEVDFESLKDGDRCLLVDSGIASFFIRVISSPYVRQDGVLTVNCEVISKQTKTPR